MSTRDVHEPYRDQLAAFALDALEPTEAADLERHLASCPKCRERLDWLRPAVNLLPASVEQLTPPEALRERVLSAVRDDARRLRAEEARQRRSWFTWPGLAMRPATALAAVALLVAGVAGGYVVQTSDDAEPAVVAAQPSPAAPGGEVAAALETADGSGTLHVSRLPKLSGDRVYQVWIQRGERMAPSSVFTIDSDGQAEVAVEGDLDGARAVLVTEEPAGGSAKPTSPPLLTADLS